VPSAAEPTGYAWRPGSAQGNGAFVIPNVESTPFLLQLGSSYLWSTSRSLDLSYPLMGRPDVELEPEGTSVTLQLSGLVPWRDADDLQWYAPSAGLAYLSTTCTPDFPVPADAGTVISGTVPSYGDWLSTCGNKPARLSPGQDPLYVTQLASYTDTDAGVDYLEVRRALVTNGLQRTDGGLLLSGTLAALPTAPQNLLFRAAEFEAQVLASGMDAGVVYNSVNVGVSPAFEQHGLVTSWPDLGLASDYTPLGGDMSVKFQYANPYPSVWTPFVSAQTVGRVRYTLPLADGGTSSGRTISVLAASREQLVGGTHPPLSVRVGTPRDVRLNGQSAFGNLSGVGLTPVVSWLPPTVGTVTRYNVRINRLYLSGGFVQRVPQSSFTTTATQLRLPPGELQAGQTYFLQVYALYEPGYDSTRPYLGTPASHYATAVTGKFQP
jgi:hypothetical protein